MLRNIILSIGIILFANSCDDYCENTDYESYLPLKVGNKWYYGDDETREIVGTKQYDGDEYYNLKIEHKSPDDVIYSHNVYYRFYGSNLYRIYNDNKFLLADFSLKEGDEFQMDEGGFIFSVISDKPNEFTFSYDHPDWADEEYEYTFKQDVGVISECNFAWAGCTYLTNYELK